MNKIKFKKYQGTGNDFVIIDARAGNLPQEIISPNEELIQRICSRNYGVGSDGIIIILSTKSNSSCRMKIFNSDGSQAEMCGNGIRCLVRYLIDTSPNINRNNISVETLAGIISTSMSEKNKVVVDMGSPVFEPSNIPTTLKLNTLGVAEGSVELDDNTFKLISVGMGNPHVVLEVNNIKEIPLETWGKQLEQSKYFPNKTNVHFVNIISSTEIDVLVWERGCGPTMACGTGACACVAAFCKLGRLEEEVLVHLPGGDLSIKWINKKGSIYMSGPAAYVYEGIYSL